MKKVVTVILIVFLTLALSTGCSLTKKNDFGKYIQKAQKYIREGKKFGKDNDSILGQIQDVPRNSSGASQAEAIYKKMDINNDKEISCYEKAKAEVVKAKDVNVSSDANVYAGMLITALDTKIKGLGLASQYIDQSLSVFSQFTTGIASALEIDKMGTLYNKAIDLNNKSVKQKSEADAFFAKNLK